MKHLLVVLLLIGPNLFALTRAQTWYYNVDEDIQISPKTLDFEPTSQDLLCAALLEPGNLAQNGAHVNNFPLPANCPSSPPIVVWGIDPDTGDTTYAALIRVKFWGEKRYQDSEYGVKALVRVLRNNYNLVVNASGDLTEVDAQFLPPLKKPPVNSPPGGNGWQSWLSSQSISINKPRIKKKHNYSIWNRTCWDLYEDNCWSAVLTWALPVRLEVHGAENGQHRIIITPDYFEEKNGAATLSVSNDQITHPIVSPYKR